MTIIFTPNQHKKSPKDPPQLRSDEKLFMTEILPPQNL